MRVSAKGIIVVLMMIFSLIAITGTALPVPEAPTGLKVTISGKGFLLTWKASANDPGIVTGYEIARATFASGPFETIAKVDKGVLTYHDSTAQPEIIYFYKVRAMAGKEYSPYSDMVTAERPGYPADEKIEMKDQRDRESYSLGYQFGENLKKQEVDLNLDIYASGIKDALGGKDPQMSHEEMRATIMELQKKVTAARQKEMKDKATKNLEEGKRFLAENQKKEGIKTLPSGLQYRVITEGSGKMPKADDTVTVHYKGTFIDGTEFDSSFKRGQPATFQVNGVIPGWTEVLQLMKEGAKWQLFIPSELAYGERGMGSRIPPSSTLIFEVELISVK